MTIQNQQSLLLGKIAAYTEILVKDPGSTIFVSLAETYRKMGMLDDARHIISKGLDLHPDFSPAHIVLARILCQLENFDGSVAAFERALEFDDESLAALVGYSRVKILLGEEDDARELLLRARHLSPADPVINKLLLSLPEDFEAVEEQPDAEQELSSASLVSPTLANLYLKQGLNQEALNIYRQLSEQNPDDLSLRRRIKELENGLTEEVISDINTESTVGPLDHHEDTSTIAEETVEDEDTFVGNTQNLEETMVDDAGSEFDGAGTDEAVVETLTQWLSNIQQRR